MFARKLFLVLIFSLSVVGMSLGQRTITDTTISVSEIWGNDANEDSIIINPDNDEYLRILDGVTVEIKPGTKIRFMDGISLLIDDGATLNAIGKADEDSIIILTSNSGAPTAGAWGSIKFNGEDGSLAFGNFSNCLIEYGGDAHVNDMPKGAIICEEYSQVIVDSCEIHACKSAAIGSPNAELTNFIRATNNTIYDCAIGIHHFSPDDMDSSNVDVESVIENNFIMGIWDMDGEEVEGVGICVQNNNNNTSEDLFVRNNIIINTEEEGIFCSDFDGEIKNNTIAHTGENSINIDANTPILVNNIFYDWSFGSGINCGVAITPTYCLVKDPEGSSAISQDVTWGTGCDSTSSPGFCVINSSADEPADVFDYHLLFSSACLHTGDSSAVADTNLNGTRIDIGGYGGPYSRDYYVGVAGTLPDGGSITDATDSPFYVIGDVILDTGDSFEISSSDEDIVFNHASSAGWQISGDLNVRGVSNAANDSRVIFKRAEIDENWTGITFNSSSMDTFEYVQISGSYHGLLISQSSKMKSGNHIVIRDVLNSAIISTSSEVSSFSDVDISLADNYGLCCTGGNVNFVEGRIDSCKTGVSLTNSSGSTIDSTVIAYNDDYGIYVNNSIPVISRNTIAKSGKAGIYLYNSTFQVGVYNQNLGNRFELNGMTW